MPEKEIKISEKASKEGVIAIGDDVVNIKDFVPNQKTRSLEGETWDKKIKFYKSSATKVSASVVMYAGKHNDGNTVFNVECIKPEHVVYRPGPEHQHAVPEHIKAFPIVVRTKENEFRFSVVPEDRTQDIMAVHEKMKADLILHEIEIDREGFFDLKGARKLLNLFEKSFSLDPEVRKQGIDLTKWELNIADPKEANRRMRMSLEIIEQDYNGVCEAAKIAVQAFEAAHNPEVKKLIPEPLPPFHEAGKIR